IDLKKVDRAALGLDKLDIAAVSKNYVWDGGAVKLTDFKDSANKPATAATVDAPDGMKWKTAPAAADIHAVKDENGQVVKDKYYVVGKIDDGSAGGKDVKLEVTLDKTEDVGGTITAKFKATGKEVEVLATGAKAPAGPLDTLDKALSKIDSQRSQLGAFQNRMQSTINNLNNSVNNLSSARSRIQDADFATEVSNMSRGQILQQAGTAVLAQANGIPNNVMSLLRG
ncbi:TPA: flagellin, partial [Morganella morganii]